MGKFNIGDRVQTHGDAPDSDVGTVMECRSSFGEAYCNVEWDVAGMFGVSEDDLYLVRAADDRPRYREALAEWERELLGYPKHAALPRPDFSDISACRISPNEAVNLASKLLQFATQTGNK